LGSQVVLAPATATVVTRALFSDYSALSTAALPALEVAEEQVSAAVASPESESIVRSRGAAKSRKAYPGNSDARYCGIHRRFRGVDDQPRANVHGFLLLSNGEHPGVGRRQHVECDAIVCRKICRPGRRAVRGKIFGGRADNPANVSNALGDEAAVRKVPDPDGDIDLLIQDMRNPVGQGHPQIDVGIGLEEICDDREDVKPAKRDGCGQRQFAPWRAVLAGGGTFRICDVFQNPLAGDDIGLAGVCQRQLAAGPNEQPCSQMRFQVRDFSTDGGEGRTQDAGSRRQASGVRDRQKHLHRLQAVHIASTFREVAFY